jgi:transposase
MGRRERRKFTPEFKREAVKAVGQPGRSLTAVGRELDVDRSVLERWVKSFAAGKYEKAPGLPLKSAQQQETEQLRRELAKVKMERDILKKALGYFAKEPT